MLIVRSSEDGKDMYPAHAGLLASQEPHHLLTGGRTYVSFEGRETVLRSQIPLQHYSCRQDVEAITMFLRSEVEKYRVLTPHEHCVILRLTFSSFYRLNSALKTD